MIDHLKLEYFRKAVPVKREMESATGNLQAASMREGSFRWQVCGLFLPDDNMRGQIAAAHPTSVGLKNSSKSARLSDFPSSTMSTRDLSFLFPMQPTFQFIILRVDCVLSLNRS